MEHTVIIVIPSLQHYYTEFGEKRSTTHTSCLAALTMSEALPEGKIGKSL